MDLFNRLSDYDVFAYLPQGFLAFAAIDYVFGTAIILNAGWDVPTGFLVVFMAYAMGHIIAGPSSFVLERWLVHRVLGEPVVHLLPEKGSKRPLSSLFPAYHEPLAEPVREAVAAKLEASGSHADKSQSKFWTAYPIAKKDEPTRVRLGSFLNMYGFCRNVSFVALSAGVAVIGKTALQSQQAEGVWSWPDFWIGAGLILVAFAMFQRFLKFYRLYSVEVFVTFSQAN